MIKSMTGFGQCTKLNENIKCTVEIKTVNNRYRDISIRLPRDISYMEEKIKSKIGEKITRGKVDVIVSFEDFSDDGTVVNINKKLAGLYIKEFRDLVKEYSLKDDVSVSDLLNLQELVQVTKKETNQELFNKVLIDVLDKALEDLVNMRKMEGQNLRDNIAKRLDIVRNFVYSIEKKSESFVYDYKNKLKDRLKSILDKDIMLDEGRLEMELAIFADKCNIDEEIVRLISHIEQFRNSIESDESIGRKLDFLVQEMNRETNTIGSKVSDLETTKIVVDIKSELEKIREQVQNIE